MDAVRSEPGGVGRSEPSDAPRDVRRRGGSAATGRRPLTGFFLLSHGWSWAFWGAAIVVGLDVRSGAGLLLLILGGAGPPLGGIIMTARHGGGPALRELGHRLVSIRRAGGRWLAVAFLLPPAALASAVALVALVAGGPVADASQARELMAAPALLLPFALGVLVFGPLPEEIGWRGYALDALQDRWDALTSSLLLGGAWALWHLPLFFMIGYYGQGGPPAPVLFIVAILIHSVLYTWIHNHTGRSVLAAIVFHYAINFFGMLVEGTAAVEWTRAGLTALVALAVLRVHGPRTLAGGGRHGRGA